MFLLHINLAGYCLRYPGYDTLLPFTISLAHRGNSSDHASNVTLDQDTKLIVVILWLALKALGLSQKSLPLCEDNVELLCNAYNINLMFVVNYIFKKAGDGSHFICTARNQPSTFILLQLNATFVSGRCQAYRSTLCQCWWASLSR